MLAWRMNAPTHPDDLQPFGEDFGPLLTGPFAPVLDELDLSDLPLLKGASLVGVDIRQFGEIEPDKANANREETFRLAATGVLKPAIARTYRLEDFAAAMADAASGQSAGRIVLTMG